MAKLSKCFLKRNKTTRDFRNLYAKLPSSIQRIARKAAIAFDADPAQPGFRLHKLRDNSVGSHKPESFSVSFTASCRAIFVLCGETPDGDKVRVWYWIGTHADYDRFCGS